MNSYNPAVPGSSRTVTDPRPALGFRAGGPFMDETENPVGPAPDIGVAADTDERREMPRCAVDVPATLNVLSHGTMMVGRMTELSLSGCRMLLPKALSRAARAAAECTFKIRGVGFRLAGVVEWAEKNLVGLQFTTISSRCRDDLVEVLCEVELENNGKLAATVNSAAGLVTAETASVSPAIETILADVAARNPAQPRQNAGAWNPFAGMTIAGTQRKALDLKPEVSRPSTSAATTGPAQSSPAPAISAAKASSPAAAAASAPATQSPAPLNQSAKQPNRGRDRRATHRCGVDTSAVIDLVNVGSKLKGHILDLSVGGCRIKTVEKFPVGIYTRIETEFQLHGLPFRLGGVIQAIHDPKTVGIRFLDMSQRKKEQVAELVAELEEGDS
jgi:c-di-GMP-binding flagellar brake protein YcgR